MQQTSTVRPLLIALLALTGTLLCPPVTVQASDDPVGVLLQEMVRQTEAALDASRAAERAETVSDVKAKANAVFEVVWGTPSDLVGRGARGASAQHGWKTRWQTTPAAFDSAFAARYGATPPEIDRPRKLGILGRGRDVREHFAVAPDSAGPKTPGARYSHDAVVAPLNNVIGWMRMDNGISKGELQPRVDLTYKWDAPVEFWKSNADTGWLQAAYAQAINILKTNYNGNVEMAREHAAGMTQLLEKALNGVDANGNGTVEPIPMEGGLRAALQKAKVAGVVGS